MDSMGFDSSGCFKDRFSFLPIVESVHTTVLGFGVPSGSCLFRFDVHAQLQEVIPSAIFQ